MKKQLKLNVDLLNKKAGDIISLDVDKEGIFKDKFWRRRLADSATDKCVEIVKLNKVKKG